MYLPSGKICHICVQAGVLSAAPSRAIGAVKDLNLGGRLRELKIPDVIPAAVASAQVKLQSLL